MVSKSEKLGARRAWLGYAMAVAGTVFVVWLRWELAQAMGVGVPLYTFIYPVVILSALLGGTGAGLVATALSAGLVSSFVLQPSGSLWIEKPADILGLALSVVVNLVMSVVGGTLRKTHRRVRERARELDHLDQIYRYAPVGLGTFDRDYRFTRINERLAEINGLPVEDHLGKSIFEIIPALAPRLQELWRPVLEEGRPVLDNEIQGETPRAPGVRRSWVGNYFPLRSGSGEVIGVIAVVFEVTERKLAMEALRESEQRANFAVEVAALGTYERNLVANEITMNEVCQQILGAPEHPPPDIASRSVHPDDAKYVMATVARAYDPALREVCAGEFRILRPDGTIRWVAGRGRVRFDDTTQPARPQKFVGVLYDITERKRADEALQRRNQRLQILHQAAADLLLAREPAELLQRLHPQIAASLGAEVFLFYEASQGNGHFNLRACGGVSNAEQRKFETMRYGRAVCARPAEALAPIVATHLQTGEEPNRRFVRKLGFRSYLYFPLMLRGHLQGTLAFASRQREDYDPTELEFFQTIARTLAEALERNRLEFELQRHATHLDALVQERTAKLQEMVSELEHFSYTITHDMRAPLRAMRGFANILIEECGPCLQGERQQYLQRIAESADRMDRLIMDALQYSTLVRGQFELEPVDTDALLRGMLETYPQFQPPNAQITIWDRLPTIMGNKAGLTQCFSNLLDNAVKFVHVGQTPEVIVWAGGAGYAGEPSGRKVGQSSLPIGANQQTAGAGSPAGPRRSRVVRIWFEDKGIGIEKAYQDKIWVMFQRLNQSYAGTGIGLALVRKAVERMGGRVGVESEPGKGSRFWVELTLAQ